MRRWALPGTAFSRSPTSISSRPQHGPALGPLQPMVSRGKPVDFDGSGRGRYLRRRQGRGLHLEGLARLLHLHRVWTLSVAVPGMEHRQALVTKLLVTNLRNHAYAKAPYLRAAESVRPELAVDVLAEAERPLVGSIADGGVIDPDVLWSCTTCGACVEQCPSTSSTSITSSTCADSRC